MSDKVLNQDINDRVPENGTVLMAQLLFREKPQQADAEKLEKEFGKLAGNIENTTNDKDKGHDMVNFSCLDYLANFSDKKDIPVLASFMGPFEFSAEKIDELQRSQFWDYKDGAEKIDEFKWNITLVTMLGGGLHYKQQAQLLLAQVDAALKCYPTCEAIYVFHSGKLTTPEAFEECKQYDLSGRFIRLAVNARFFNINGTNGDMIVDTIGFYAFGAADVQVHFNGLDPNHVVNYVYNIASYQFDNEFPIKSGETVDSIAPDGSIQWEPQWITRYEDSLIQPVRTVLDINCGEFAAGTREN